MEGLGPKVRAVCIYGVRLEVMGLGLRLGLNLGLTGPLPHFHLSEVYNMSRTHPGSHMSQELSWAIACLPYSHGL